MAIGMFAEFKSFLTKSNALALALGVVIGAAVGKVVTAIVSDVIMPLVGLTLPAGEWREAKIVLAEGTNEKGEKTVNALKYGDLIGNLVDFVIVAFVIFAITRFALRQKPPPAPPTRTCPECLESVPAAAKRCRACASALPAAT